MRIFVGVPWQGGLKRELTNVFTIRSVHRSINFLSSYSSRISLYVMHVLAFWQVTLINGYDDDDDESTVTTNEIFSHFGRHIFGTFRAKTNIVIPQRHEVWRSQIKTKIKKHPQGKRDLEIEMFTAGFNFQVVQLEEDGGGSTGQSWMERSCLWPTFHRKRQGVSK